MIWRGLRNSFFSISSLCRRIIGYIVFPYEEVLEANGVKGKTLSNIRNLYGVFGYERIFGRTDIMNVLGITSSPASALISRMKNAKIIEPVKGLGKGRYRFVP